MPLSIEDCAVSYKVLILGDDSVGKSAILDCLMGRSFRENMYPTIGVDFVRKIFEVDGALVQLVIWDTAGQERFRSITRLQYKGVQGLILVYDVTNEMSFETLKYWIHSIQDEISRPDGSYEPIPMILCGNKSDLISEKKVSEAKGRKMAEREMAFGFYETSAKTGHNIYTAFQQLAFHITDISHPKLMKSYHPHSIRPISQHDPALNQDANLRQFKPKSRFRFVMGSSPTQALDTTKDSKRTSITVSSKGNHSNDLRRKSDISCRPWETTNDEVPATNFGGDAKVKDKSKTKTKDKKNTRKDSPKIVTPKSGVWRRTFGCLLCRTVCLRKKPKRKKERVA